MAQSRTKNAERGGEQFTTQNIVVPSVNDAPQIAPEFVRLPRPKYRCAITGLSRSSLNDLIAAGKIRAVKLRQRGARRGITLINRKSLLDYLHGLEKS